jgi:G protein-coupled receptor 107
MFPVRLCAVFLLAAGLLAPVAARINDLKIVGDERAAFNIETFGFHAKGVVKIAVKTFGMAPRPTDGNAIQAGFLLRKAESESEALATIETALESKACLLDSEDNVLADSKWLAPPDTKQWTRGWTHEHVIEEKEAGLYQVIFARCKPDGVSTTVSFELVMTFYNVDAAGKPLYLSAGDSSLPTLFLFMAIGYAGMLVGWIVYCRQHHEHVHHVHMMMAALLLFKALAALFHSISYHFIQQNGQPVGWNVVYYIFAFLKGTTFFVVILLVGTGWSMVKPFLNPKEKKILFMVLPLQVLDNIALVVMEEISPGSQAWLTWRDLLNLFDIVCCCMILFPIVWQIRALRMAAATDGKAERNLKKLEQYRNFYVSVVAYIYFTRIIVRLLGATLSYERTYMATVAGEGATAAFFAWTGKVFRPMSNNPYLRVGTDSDQEEEDDEFGLDDPIELTAAGTKKKKQQEAPAAGEEDDAGRGRRRDQVEDENGIEMGSIEV